MYTLCGSYTLYSGFNENTDFAQKAQKINKNNMFPPRNGTSHILKMVFVVRE